ncbi:MAG: carbohydrate ABC transporter permease [Rhodospirillales bacterium]|nr:carbohydrate ABC transporter permease [Rhodospirillales bacterium]
MTAFVRVLLPLAAPGLVASAIFAFTLSWNEFLYALVFIQDETATTVPVGLNLLIYGDVFHWGQLMAASVITCASRATFSITMGITCETVLPSM